MRRIKFLLIKLFCYFYSKLICLNLMIINNLYKNVYYNVSIGFADTLGYALKNYSKIKSRGYFLNFGFVTNKTAEFLFEKNKIINLFFYIFKYFPHYQLVSKLKYCNFFLPRGKLDEHGQGHLSTNKDSIKNLINAKLNIWYSKNEKFDPINIFGKKYICLAIKHQKSYSNILTESAIRHTENLTPLIEVIKELSKSNISFCILGLKSDPILKKLKEEFKDYNKFNVKFLIEYSKDYSLADQIITANNSLGLIANPHGITQIFYFLQKKIVHINCPYGKGVFLDPMNAENEKKYCKYLYKNYLHNNQIIKLPFNVSINENTNSNKKIVLEKKNVRENTKEEILVEVKNFILK